MTLSYFLLKLVILPRITLFTSSVPSAFVDFDYEASDVSPKILSLIYYRPLITLSELT